MTDEKVVEMVNNHCPVRVGFKWAFVGGKRIPAAQWHELYRLHGWKLAWHYTELRSGRCLKQRRVLSRYGETYVAWRAMRPASSDNKEALAWYRQRHATAMEEVVEALHSDGLEAARRLKGQLRSEGLA